MCTIVYIVYYEMLISYIVIVQHWLKGNRAYMAMEQKWGKLNFPLCVNM